MCLLSFLPAGTQPDLQALRNGTIVNDDGHGFAIVVGDRMLVRHSLNAEQLIDAFAAARAAHRDGPALFHSRLGTHGDNSTRNCHPFAVGGDERTVLAHNGILPQRVQPGKDDPRSDTRITAEEFLPALGSLRHRRIRLQVQRWMGPLNKIVVLSVDRRFTDTAFILNEQQGTWDGGIWYSNDGYLPLTARSWYTSWWSEREARAFGGGRCDGCDAWLDTPDGECPQCGWCLDCASLPDRCLCYQPMTPHPADG